MSTERLPQHEGGEGVPDLTREDVVREIARLAALDQRRGVHYWFDPELTDALRSLALGGRGAVARGAVERGTAARDAAARVTAAGSSPGTVPTSSKTRSARTAEDASDPTAGSAPTRPSETPPPAASTPAGATPPKRRTPPPEPGTPTSSNAGRASKASRIPKWGAPPVAVGRDADWAEKLAAVGERASTCTRCGLCETRNKVVFGVGGAAVPLVFVGEAPGADEDRQGYPFVGRAGQLLDKIIHAIGLERDEIYICNVLKCRPPGNRNPAPDEIANCTPFLVEQLAILRPKVICTLGLFASQFLLESSLSMGRLRGQVFDHGGTPVIPTYHPAALLRNPSLKAAVWDDVQLVRRTLDS